MHLSPIKGSCRSLLLSCINDNDLVILECTIMCFKCNATSVAVYDGAWKYWHTQFELLTVIKLIEEPEMMVEKDLGIQDNVHI
ncbi:uncharacterized protein LAESUDRAFT_721793 [Laetiporus sulphureus 93-53]|uniref:Uncharacterized protein n=1 Tax=Laetiporus sulphureus 93-53 TaxID=1314785 RepID=A0A165GJJ3_9APHY|nr:uncharacterized protein LAESUDRAFT_721793 [Laetiporus sulphureus 93-53]KZT10440.1 hypothetical protein LAESUDRAFT_721793 [Laetiporus sulphureus 93-53]